MDWLQIEQQVSPAARGARVPRLTVQPLVENAIKHGLARRRARGLVRLSVRVADGRLEIAVRDNGVGPGAPAVEPGFGLGLQNVRERLATVYGTDWRLTLDDALDGGAIAVLSIPARYGNPDAADRPTTPDTTELPAALDWARRHPALATGVGWTLWSVAWGLQSRTYLMLRNRSVEADP